MLSVVFVKKNCLFYSYPPSPVHLHPHSYVILHGQINQRRYCDALYNFPISLYESCLILATIFTQMRGESRCDEGGTLYKNIHKLLSAKEPCGISKLDEQLDNCAIPLYYEMIRLTTYVVLSLQYSTCQRTTIEIFVKNNWFSLIENFLNYTVQFNSVLVVTDILT